MDAAAAVGTVPRSVLSRAITGFVAALLLAASVFSLYHGVWLIEVRVRDSYAAASVIIAATIVVLGSVAYLFARVRAPGSAAAVGIAAAPWVPVLFGTLPATQGTILANVSLLAWLAINVGIAAYWFRTTNCRWRGAILLLFGLPILLSAVMVLDYPVWQGALAFSHDEYWSLHLTTGGESAIPWLYEPVNG